MKQMYPGIKSLWDFFKMWFCDEVHEKYTLATLTFQKVWPVSCFVALTLSRALGMPQLWWQAGTMGNNLHTFIQQLDGRKMNPFMVRMINPTDISLIPSHEPTLTFGCCWLTKILWFYPEFWAPYRALGNGTDQEGHLRVSGGKISTECGWMVE